MVELFWEQCLCKIIYMIEDVCKRSTRWSCQIKLTFNSVLSRIKDIYPGRNRKENK